MKRPFSMVVALLFAASPAVLYAAEAKTASKPNVVLILADDLGWSDLGCCGSTFYETPAIDRLAAQGMRFNQAYAAANVCSPTRASIMTGKYPSAPALSIAPERRRRSGSRRPATNRERSQHCARGIRRDWAGAAPSDVRIAA